MANESDRPHDDLKDPTLAAGWRMQSREIPPPALDAAILAAAHRAVGSAPRAATAEALRPPRWWLPFAAAAVIGVVAVGLVQLASHDEIDVAQAPAARFPPATAPAPAGAPASEAATETARSEPATAMPIAPMPAPTAATPSQDLAQSAVPAPQRSAPRAPTLDHAAPASAPVAVEAERRREPEQRSAEVAPPTAPAPAAEPAAPSPAAKPAAPAGVAAAARERAAPAPGAAKIESAQALGARDRAAAPASSAPAAASGVAGALTQQRAAFSRAEAIELARDPDAWLARIGKLHDAGRDDEAIAELREFDALVPGARERMPIALRRLLERAR